MNPDSNLSAGQFGMQGNMGSSGMPSTMGSGQGGMATAPSTSGGGATAMATGAAKPNGGSLGGTMNGGSM
jgi:hypothetical protein